MLISYFTPFHKQRPDFIRRAYDSIRKQTCPSWEWVLVPNNDGKNLDLSFIDDKRVKIIPYNGSTNSVGEVKKFAALSCSGEVVCEFDWDDEITPECTSIIADTYEKDNTIDFAYSNDAAEKDGKPFTFSTSFGWTYRPFKWKGMDLQELVSFPPSPASFSKIWYGPDHIRTWKKSFYEKIGGHDPKLDVLDDQDLFCRSYIHGNCKHIDHCLYVYHVHDQNTCYTDRNARIQEETVLMHDKYIYQLVEKWCDINKLRKIDLCGGFNKPAGYESLDLHDADIIADLDERWPIEDGTVGVIRAHDAIEHLKDKIHPFKEAYRVLAPQGWMLIEVPTTDGRGAFQDPTHKSFFNSNSFWYYTKRDFAKYIGTPVKFQLNRILNYFPNEFNKFHEIEYTKVHLYKFDPNGRTPGSVEI